MKPLERVEKANQLLKESYSLDKGKLEREKILLKAIRYDDKNDRVFAELSSFYLIHEMHDLWKKNIDIAVSLNPAKWKPLRAYQYICFLENPEDALVDLYSLDLIDSSQWRTMPFIDLELMLGISHTLIGDHSKALTFLDSYIDNIIPGKYIDPSAYHYSLYCYVQKQLWNKANNHIDLYHSQMKGYKPWLALVNKVRVTNDSTYNNTIIAGIQFEFPHQNLLQ